MKDDKEQKNVKLVSHQILFGAEKRGRMTSDYNKKYISQRKEKKVHSIVSKNPTEFFNLDVLLRFKFGHRMF